LKNTRVVLVAVLVVVVVVVAALALSPIFIRSNASQMPTPSGGTAKYILATTNQTVSISARVDQTFIVQLQSNAGSTGYDWNVTTSSGIQYVNYTVVSTSTLIGGPQTRNYFFRAVQTGSQTITLRDMRSWAPYPVADTIDLRVSVS